MPNYSLSSTALDYGKLLDSSYKINDILGDVDTREKAYQTAIAEQSVNAADIANYLDPNSELYNIYKDYNDKLEDYSEMIAHGQWNSSIGHAINGLRTEYVDKIKPIGDAVFRRSQDIAKQVDAINKNPQILYNRMASELPVEQYYNNPTFTALDEMQDLSKMSEYSQKAYTNLADTFKRVAWRNAYSISDEELMKNFGDLITLNGTPEEQKLQLAQVRSALTDVYTMFKQGLPMEDVVKTLQRLPANHPISRAIANNIMEMSGMRNWYGMDDPETGWTTGRNPVYNRGFAAAVSGAPWAIGPDTLTTTQGGDLLDYSTAGKGSGKRSGGGGKDKEPLSNISFNKYTSFGHYGPNFQGDTSNYDFWNDFSSKAGVKPEEVVRTPSGNMWAETVNSSSGSSFNLKAGKNFYQNPVGYKGLGLTPYSIAKMEYTKNDDEYEDALLETISFLTDYDAVYPKVDNDGNIIGFEEGESLDKAKIAEDIKITFTGKTFGGKNASDELKKKAKGVAYDYLNNELGNVFKNESLILLNLIHDKLNKDNNAIIYSKHNGKDVPHINLNEEEKKQFDRFSKKWGNDREFLGIINNNLESIKKGDADALKKIIDEYDEGLTGKVDGYGLGDISSRASSEFEGYKYLSSLWFDNMSVGIWENTSKAVLPQILANITGAGNIMPEGDYEAFTKIGATNNDFASPDNLNALFSRSYYSTASYSLTKSMQNEESAKKTLVEGFIREASREKAMSVDKAGRSSSTYTYNKILDELGYSDSEIEKMDRNDLIKRLVDVHTGANNPHEFVYDFRDEDGEIKSFSIKSASLYNNLDVSNNFLFSSYEKYKNHQKVINDIRNEIKEKRRDMLRLGFNKGGAKKFFELSNELQQKYIELTRALQLNENYKKELNYATKTSLITIAKAIGGYNALSDATSTKTGFGDASLESESIE